MRSHHIPAVPISAFLCVLLGSVIGSGDRQDTAAPAKRESPSEPGEIGLHTQTRDPKNDEVRTHVAKVDSRKVGVIVIDPWNYHWCMTWSEQAGGTVPRMNQALAGARKLGMQVLWAPTDVASMYAGVPQRERALAFPYVEVPVLS
jgi:hypothetical protein